LKKSPYFSLLVVSGICLCLNACGQKGPLYLPEKKSLSMPFEKAPKPQAKAHVDILKVTGEAN
jgi:predicted small lipoprotein YifL